MRETPSAILDNSIMARHLKDFWGRRRDRLFGYSRGNLAVALIKNAWEELYFLPVRTVAIALVSGIIVNVALSIASGKQIGLWGWLIRGLFLLAGISGISCRADWATIKSNSTLLTKKRGN